MGYSVEGWCEMSAQAVRKAKRILKPFNLTLDDDLREWINARAEAEHLKPSQFIRRELWKMREWEESHGHLQSVQRAAERCIPPLTHPALRK